MDNAEPTRYRVADIQTQMTLGCGNGGILVTDPNGPIVSYGDYARLKAEVERLTDTLNKLVKTPPEATGGVRVKVDFWTQYGSRLPSSYETFWENAAKEGKQS